MPEGLRRRFDPDDFIQDALLIVATSPSIDRGEPLARLVMTVALRAMRMELRRSWRERRAATHTTEEGEAAAVDGGPGPADVAIGREMRERLIGLGTRPNVRLAIAMRLDGHPISEIERAAGWSPGAGPQRFLQIRRGKRFRRCLSH